MSDVTPVLTLADPNNCEVFDWPEFDMEDDFNTVTIYAGPAQINIRGTSEGIIVDVFSVDDPDGDAVASTHTMYADIIPEEHWERYGL